MFWRFSIFSLLICSGTRLLFQCFYLSFLIWVMHKRAEGNFRDWGRNPYTATEKWIMPHMLGALVFPLGHSVLPEKTLHFLLGHIPWLPAPRNMGSAPPGRLLHSGLKYGAFLLPAPPGVAEHSLGGPDPSENIPSVIHRTWGGALLVVEAAVNLPSTCSLAPALPPPFWSMLYLHDWMVLSLKCSAFHGAVWWTQAATVLQPHAEDVHVPSISSNNHVLICGFAPLLSVMLPEF